LVFFGTLDRPGSGEETPAPAFGLLSGFFGFGFPAVVGLGDCLAGESLSTIAAGDFSGLAGFLSFGGEGTAGFGFVGETLAAALGPCCC
jgi:hypothetical protein